MIRKRLQMILTPQELNRIVVRGSDDSLQIRVDAHGLTRAEARMLINNVILIPHTNFNLLVIHGFNHGTAIKEMLETDFDNGHILSHSVDPFNKGVTHMQIAA